MWVRITHTLTIIISLQIRMGAAQLGDATHTTEDILDIYQPRLLTRGNVTRIVDGYPIPITQVPWQIALYRYGYFTCGGSIITKEWVLTAAHCVVSGGSFAVRAGSANYTHGGEIRYVSRIIVHALYSPSTMNHDIALLRVRRNFVWKYGVRPVRLPREQRRLPGRYFISGWGTVKENGTISQHLRGVTILKLDRSECQKEYSPRGIVITRQMICAAARNRDSCQGDSGGALVYRRIQYGIVSFGIGCARPTYAGVYTNLRLQISWIRSAISKYGGQQPTIV